MPDKLREQALHHGTDAIKRLCLQMRRMPELNKQAKVVDELLVNRLEELKSAATVVLEQLHEQKREILKQFDSWIMPIAKEILECFLQDAEQLKNRLDDKLNHVGETTSDEWRDQAKSWAQLYLKWHDRGNLIQKILEGVADYTKRLIDKDVRLIKDYQIQSLAHLRKQSQAFENVEKKLGHAIEEPLKELMILRDTPQEHGSLQQVSEWVKNLQATREGYFNVLLMKIDHVIKDVVHLEGREEEIDEGQFLETEGEMTFMEKELYHLNQDLAQIHLAPESDKQFILARIEALLEHVEQVSIASLPISFQKRKEALKAGILHALHYANSNISH